MDEDIRLGIKAINENWSSLSNEQKKDIFLWKMIWFHSEKHIPGSPSGPIDNLAKVIADGTRSSESLTSSIRTATWVGGLAAVAGVIIALISLFK